MNVKPVPRLADQILLDWAEELADHLKRPVDQIKVNGLNAYDFPGGRKLHIKLMDGSFVQFEYAFHVVNPAKNAIAVFTEHCGYHVFPNHDAIVSHVEFEPLYSQADELYGS